MEPNKIVIDDVSHDLDQFSPQVKQAVATYNVLLSDLSREQLAVMKTQAAIQMLGGQITEAVKKELQEMADVKKADAEAAPAAADETSAD